METSKVGQGMFALAFILGLSMLTMFFGNIERERYNPNHDPTSVIFAESVSVDLKRNRQGHYVVSGTINNQPAEFLLDTGATDVVVPSKIAKTLHLRQGRASTAMTANGSIRVYDTMIDQLKIGDISLFNVRASINPAMSPPAILLGMSALSQIEFTQIGDSLTLTQHNRQR